MLSFFFF